MTMDTTSVFNVFPFVAKDTTGQSGLFAIVSLKRYDMLYINQLAVTDENDFMVSAIFLKKIQIRSNFESVLFWFDEPEMNGMQELSGDLKFNAWGTFGSAQVCFDSVQTENFMVLVKLACDD